MLHKSFWKFYFMKWSDVVSLFKLLLVSYRSKTLSSIYKNQKVVYEL